MRLAQLALCARRRSGITSLASAQIVDCGLQRSYEFQIQVLLLVLLLVLTLPSLLLLLPLGCHTIRRYTARVPFAE